MNVKRANGWWYDKDTGSHYLPIDDDLSMVVYKTAGGDYSISCHSDECGYGGDNDYEESLGNAKRRAEQMKADGTYIQYAPEQA